MKYLLLSLILAGVINTSALAQDEYDSLLKVEVFCKNWGCHDQGIFDLELLIGNKYLGRSEFTVIISNPLFNDLFLETLECCQKEINLEYMNYCLAVLCYYKNRIDTVSFDCSFSYTKINNKYFKFNWGAFNLILGKLPQLIYNRINLFLLWMKYE